MDNPIYVKITNAHTDMPFWYNKFLDMGKPAPMFAVIQSPDKPNYWRVVDYTHEIRKSDCEVVPTLQPENKAGIYTTPVLALKAKEYAIEKWERDYQEQAAVAFMDGYKVAQSEQTLPEGQHLISTEQLKDLHDKLGSYDLIQQRNLLQEWFPTVFVPAKTYKVGDVFTNEAAPKFTYELIALKDNHVLMMLNDYTMYCNHHSKDRDDYIPKAIQVSDPQHITEAELQKIIGIFRKQFTLLPDSTDQMV